MRATRENPRLTGHRWAGEDEAAVSLSRGSPNGLGAHPSPSPPTTSPSPPPPGGGASLLHAPHHSRGKPDVSVSPSPRAPL